MEEIRRIYVYYNNVYIKSLHFITDLQQIQKIFQIFLRLAELGVTVVMFLTESPPKEKKISILITVLMPSNKLMSVASYIKGTRLLFGPL